MIRAEIHRPNLGSLAYVWIGSQEFVRGSTSDAHKLLRSRGAVTHIETIRNGQTSVERYIITKQEGEA